MLAPARAGNVGARVTGTSGDMRAAPQGGRRARRPFVRAFFACWAIVFALSALWAIATPLMASPDEPSHVIQAAAVVRGQVVGPPSSQYPGATEVVVPRWVADSRTLPNCFTPDPAVPADCARWPGHDQTPVDWVTTSTLNSPVAFFIAGLPTLFLSGAPAFYAMRLVLALLTSGLIASAFAALQQTRGRFASIGLAAATTPVALYLGGMVNPSGVEIAAAIAATSWGALLVTRRAEGSRRWWWVAAFLVAVFFLCNTRSIALGWLAAIILLLFFLVDREVGRELLRSVAGRVAVGGTALIAVVSAAYFVLPKGISSTAPPQTSNTPLDTFSWMLDNTFDYASGWVGKFGWLDTPTLGWVVVLWSAIAGMLALAALAYGSPRSRWAVAGLLGGLALVPAVSQALLVKDWGFVWQGRYTLALFSITVLAAAVALDRRFPGARTARTIRPLAIASAVALAVAQLVSFAWALRRFSIGISIEKNWFALLTAPQWQPKVPPVVLIVAFAAVLVAGLLLALRRRLRRETEPALAQDHPAYVTSSHSPSTGPIGRRSLGGSTPEAD
ncbi:hypothetical protein DOE76_03435 [Leifsonia sp. ku-ls]|nr:hypothetical protein DOE76_03435 [Leifsonia sp. ku-ls]